MAKLIVIAAPSGAGKTSLIKALLTEAKHLKFTLSVSYTTRKKRATEEHGKSYYFISKEEFELMIKEKEFLEYLIYRSGTITEIYLDVVMKRDVATVNSQTPISALHTLLLSQNSVIVIDNESKPLNIITKIDFVEWMMKTRRGLL